MRGPGIGATSGFSDVDRAGDPDDYVRRLDAKGSSGFWRGIKARLLDLLLLSPGDQVLDVGCGTGDDARALAAPVGPAGRSVGVDASAVMIAEAERRAQGLSLPVEFRRADARSLPFPAGSFDACRVERVLQHLEDPRAALGEMWRVARSGARVAAAEPDYGELSIEGADPALTRRILDCRRSHFRSPRVGLHLPVLCGRLGVEALSVARIRSENAHFPQDWGYLHKLATAAQDAGAAEPGECEAWLLELGQAAAVGRYRQSFSVYLVGGRKP